MGGGGGADLSGSIGKNHNFRVGDHTAAAPLNSLERVKVVVFTFVFILVGDRETSGME